MNPSVDRAPARGLASLRRFVEKQPAAERCDLCSLILPDQHQHLFDPRDGRLLCACDPCAMLFSSSGETQYRRVPRDMSYLPDFRMSDGLWNSLAIPIGLVFIYVSSISGQVMALYPSPAGPTESVLDLESWEEITRENPALQTMGPDVEALLVNRTNGLREYYLVPIDECYKLTGLVRKYWRGFSGGNDAWEQIRNFFDVLKQRSELTTTPHARSQF